jgi:hypothetical protein
MKLLCGFTELELQTLRAIEKCVDKPDVYRAASALLKVEPSTLRNRLYKIRRRFRQANDFVIAYKRWRETLFRKSGGRLRIL